MKINLYVALVWILLATAAGAQQFTYDALGRLTSVRYDATRRVEYQLDLQGNTTNIVIPAAQPETDTDADGMADAWEWVYFNSLAQAAAGDFNQDTRSNLDHYLGQTDPTDPDPDDDGMSNEDERVAGTDPLSSGSVLGVTTASTLSTGYVLNWPSVAGKQYWVARTPPTMTSTWSRIAGPLNATAPLNTHTDTTAVGHAAWWYRIEMDRPK